MNYCYIESNEGLGIFKHGDSVITSSKYRSFKGKISIHNSDYGLQYYICSDSDALGGGARAKEMFGYRYSWRLTNCGLPDSYDTITKTNLSSKEYNEICFDYDKNKC